MSNDTKANAAYAIENLRELEDLAKKFGLAPAMETHFAREALGCEHSGVSLQRLAPNARQPFGHKHGEEEELYVVVAAFRTDSNDLAVLLREVEAWVAEESLCAIRYMLDERIYVLESGGPDWSSNPWLAEGEESSQQTTAN